MFDLEYDLYVSFDHRVYEYIIFLIYVCVFISSQLYICIRFDMYYVASYQKNTILLL